MFSPRKSRPQGARRVLQALLHVNAVLELARGDPGGDLLHEFAGARDEVADEEAAFLELPKMPGSAARRRPGPTSGPGSSCTRRS